MSLLQKTSPCKGGGARGVGHAAESLGHAHWSITHSHTSAISVSW